MGKTWYAVTVLLLVPLRAKLFVDLSPSELVPLYDACTANNSRVECERAFESGKGAAPQVWAEMANRVMRNKTSGVEEMMTRTRLDVLLLIPSIWKHFHRRRLMRRALHICNWGESYKWYFLMGYVPQELRKWAIAEAAAQQDILLLQTEDAVQYAHVGDSFVSDSFHPELRKIILSMRLLFGIFNPKFVMLCDDDAFVSIPSLFELLNLLPTERVYLGNMIDTVPQRDGRQDLAMDFSTYVSAPSRMPLFAHGMAYIISSDIADLIADLGLQMRGFGQDDMLLGMWLRATQNLHYFSDVHRFVDHEESGTMFSRKCTLSQVVVHRMTPNRWRRFNAELCHVCGEATAQLPEVPPDEPNPAEVHLRLQEKQTRPKYPCVAEAELSCQWAAAPDGAAPTSSDCTATCKNHAYRRVARNLTSTKRCGRWQCLALCARRPCYEQKTPSDEGSASSEPAVPQIVFLVFGSPWEAATERSYLRTSLRVCKSREFGVVAVEYLFVMSPLPHVSKPQLRSMAIKEMVRHHDIAFGRPASASPHWSSNASYAYEDAWRIVLERFGGSSYIMLQDYRSFVNVPFVVHYLLPKFPLTGVYFGFLMDETLFGHCNLESGMPACVYLYHRRAPVFAHGMGFIVSADVARFVADFSRHVPLISWHMPSDVAYGMWVQSMHGVQYLHSDGAFHHWPDEDVGHEDASSARKRELLERPISDISGVVFPMRVDRWRLFDVSLCQLGSSETSFTEVRQETGTTGITQSSISLGVALVQDCWRGMGGRPEAWYLVCCEVGWEKCWGGSFTRERCCPASGDDEKQAVSSAASSQIEVLQRFLGFSTREFSFFIDELRGKLEQSQASAVDLGMTGLGRNTQCLSSRDCAQEAFARLYKGFWREGLLPLRHPWHTDVKDRLFGYVLQQRERNDGWSPHLQEHLLERRQIAFWLQRAAEEIDPSAIPGEKRCMEWDTSTYSKRFFARHCDAFDAIRYETANPRVVRRDTEGGRTKDMVYYADIHKAHEVIEKDTIGLVVCCQVFEHLRRPHLAMEQLFRLVMPGGYVVWSAPLFSTIHGSPDDYFRYTPDGAMALAKDAGFLVVGGYTPGGLRELAGYMLGLTATYWSEEEVLNESASLWPLQVYLMLQKPSVN